MNYRRLIQHELDFEKAFTFFCASLNDVNILCSHLLKVIDFKEGKFFTLLPREANIERLYEFETGCILPQNPIQVQLTSSGDISTYSFIPTIKCEIVEFLYDKIKNSNKEIAIFDDVIRDVSDDTELIKKRSFL